MSDWREDRKQGLLTNLRNPQSPKAVISLDGRIRHALEVGRTRLIVAGALMAMAFVIIGIRLVDLTLLQGGRANNTSTAQEIDEAPPVQTRRADIVDRNGIVLATTLPTASLYAEPKKIPNPEIAARLLADILPEISQDKLLKKLSSDRAFIWIKRNLTPRQQYAINGLGIPGLNFEQEQRRFYPHKNLSAHIVGFTDVDNKGLAGVEQSFDTALRENGEPLELSIDLRVQHILTEEMSAAMQEFSAIGAAGLVMDINTGEVISSVSLPTFDPDSPGDAPDDARFNRATLGIYEMGSTFKLLTAAMALDEGVASVYDGYDVSKPIRISRFSITDYKPMKRWLSVPEILIYSSNIGTVQMALEVGTESQRKYLSNFGLLRTASTELSEVGTPLVPSPWREINTMTISYGHGIAVSPLQMTTAVSSLVNGGVMKPATFIKRDKDYVPAGRRILNEKTSILMRDMMRLVVLHGSGRNADAEGYLVGGKTGTADKLKGGRYVTNSRVSSFVAAFPMNNPRYVVYVMVDEPKGTKKTYGFATGGWVAAPVVKRVVERMAPLLGIQPVHIESADDAGNSILKKAKARMEGRKIAAR
ncbi:penicillin-binding protein 2 [Kiloniella laminariae]|uniref:Penicillin-binding protein 2 n=1 Tax=Kiloniella laminariae TaxID=454162 RepID=A0ABT4LDX7_9PROT|nr:penicillin-binding protein 2 [Kiloniella laminariae]MCZ4279299.1 penicillin-binding protein 2 [Kiloniella laminariae]